VADILYGPRRVIRAIVIELDAIEQSEHFETVAPEAIGSLPPDDLVRRLQNGGLWPLIRALPFRDIADPRRRPPALIVSLGALEPWQPSPAVYLRENDDAFAAGLLALKRLADEVWVAAADPDGLPAAVRHNVTHRFTGRYPADDPGTLLYHLKRTANQNRCWYVNGQDVLQLGRLLLTGTYPVSRVVAVAGTRAADRHHVLTRVGAPLDFLAGKPAKVDGRRTRRVVGGLLRGYDGAESGYLGLYESALALVPEGDEREFLALFNPGPNKPTWSRAYLSRLNPAPLEYDCNRHGEVRACIGCMHCADVCPVDILPQLAYKAILAEEVEESLQHGLLDCVECGLCSYVCPAKIELTDAMARARADYRKEQAGG
jgi:Na+-transporting NADH:ubiquinone oxidoreductase subunit A